MPATLDEWPKVTRASKYDWDEFFSGAIVKLTKGEDFECDIESIRVQAYGAARARGLRLKSVKMSETELALQALAPEPEEPKKPGKKKGTNGKR